MYIFNKECQDQSVTQGHKTPQSFELLSEQEFEAIGPYVSSLPEKVLDLGCGLGRMSIYLNWKFQSEKTKYYLADTTAFTNNGRKGWNPIDTWYSDLELTKQFCELNGLKNFELVDILKGELEKLENIDFVFSFMAVGYHNPVENYIDILKKITKKDALMIFGVRRYHYEDGATDDFLKQFSFCAHHPTGHKKERLLVLRW